jgi:hypothetical protein
MSVYTSREGAAAVSRRRRSTQVMPVNVSALQPNYTAPNYINDTVEVFRTCPEYVDQRGGQEITVIGRNLCGNQPVCRYAIEQIS